MLFFTSSDVVMPIDRHWPRCDVAASFFATKCGILNTGMRQSAVMGSLKQDYWQKYVGGNWVDGDADRLTVENPEPANHWPRSRSPTPPISPAR